MPLESAKKKYDGAVRQSQSKKNGYQTPMEMAEPYKSNYFLPPKTAQASTKKRHALLTRSLISSVQIGSGVRSSKVSSMDINKATCSP